jgi:tetratricopeptide (TPR) repeat protein
MNWRWNSTAKRWPPSSVCWARCSPSVLNTQHAIAVALANLQRFDEALAMHRAQVVARRQLHGPRSAKVSSALNEVANVLQDAGRLEEAVATYQEALALDEQISGRKSIDVAVRLNNLASALEDLGDPAPRRCTANRWPSAAACWRRTTSRWRAPNTTWRAGCCAPTAARKPGRCWTAAVPRAAPSCRPRTTRR